MSQANRNETSSSSRISVGLATIRLFDLLCDWDERRRQRTILARMSQRDLNDIGWNGAVIEAESSKPFWKK